MSNYIDRFFSLSLRASLDTPFLLVLQLAERKQGTRTFFTKTVRHFGFRRRFLLELRLKASRSFQNESFRGKAFQCGKRQRVKPTPKLTPETKGVKLKKAKNNEKRAYLKLLKLICYFLPKIYTFRQFAVYYRTRYSIHSYR